MLMADNPSVPEIYSIQLESQAIPVARPGTTAKNGILQYKEPLFTTYR